MYRPIRVDLPGMNLAVDEQMRLSDGPEFALVAGPQRHLIGLDGEVVVADQPAPSCPELALVPRYNEVRCFVGPI
jgi:hypothetical protein